MLVELLLHQLDTQGLEVPMQLGQELPLGAACPAGDVDLQGQHCPGSEAVTVLLCGGEAAQTPCDPRLCSPPPQPVAASMEVTALLLLQGTERPRVQAGF